MKLAEYQVSSQPVASSQKYWERSDCAEESETDLLGGFSQAYLADVLIRQGNIALAEGLEEAHEYGEPLPAEQAIKKAMQIISIYANNLSRIPCMNVRTVVSACVNPDASITVIGYVVGIPRRRQCRIVPSGEHWDERVI